MKQDGRDRVTVDLRGAGPRVQELATAQGVTIAAFVRRTVLAQLEQPSASKDVFDAADASEGGPLLKVTLRLPTAHVLLLRMRARRADVSQGAYVAGLIEGMPLLLASSDRREATAALLRSTDQLAVISTDVRAFMRLLKRGASPELESYRARIMSLPEELRSHLAIACEFLSEVSKPGPARSAARRAATRR